jgi:leader peptidase (prepilin peptidase)/N-methyltransferase
MFYFLLAIAFIFGLSIGSFLNVLVLRMDSLNTVWNTRSHCPNCKHTLAWYDLVPLFSYAILRGRCRYCRKPISWQYPLVELITGTIFGVLFAKYGFDLSLLYYGVIFSLLMVVAVYDIKTQLVPEYFVWGALILALLGGWYFGNFGFLSMIYGGLVSGGLLAILVYASREKWMGAGDIKIGLILGFLLGYPIAIFGIFASFLIGAVIGLIYIYFKRKTIKASLPFAPFIIFSILFALIIGQTVFDWYWGTFLY